MLRPAAVRRSQPNTRSHAGQTPVDSTAAPTVLVTGFDAFGGSDINPSGTLAQALHGEHVGKATVVGAILPTVFAESLPALRLLLRKHRPQLVLCLGLAQGRTALSFERVAINVIDARIPDNRRARPVDVPVVAKAPAAYFSTLPIKAVARGLTRAGIAAEISQTAGTFVCNQVFYGLMHTLARNRTLRDTRGGFVHVPQLPEQGNPSMALDDMLAGLRLAIQTALRMREDIRVAAGAIQ